MDSSLKLLQMSDDCPPYTVIDVLSSHQSCLCPGKSGVGPPVPTEFRASSSSVGDRCRNGRKLSQYSYISHREGFGLLEYCAYWSVGSKIIMEERKQDCFYPSQLLTAGFFVIVLGPGTSTQTLCIFSRRQWPR